MINTNNRFITEDSRRGERGPMVQRKADPFAFEPQRFQPTIKVNNRFIKENSRNYERGRLQECDQDAVTSLQVQNNKAINRNIAENYLTEGSQFNLMKGPQSESTFSHVMNNANGVQDMVENYSQQAQRNPDARGQDRIGKNSIN